MSALETSWKHATEQLGISIISPFEVAVPGGQAVCGEFLVEHFGGDNGTIVVTRYERVKPFIDKLATLGYGFSVLSEDGDYSVDGIAEMLSEWGWTGSDRERPRWLAEDA